MQQSLNNIDWLHGSFAALEDKPMIPFADEVIEELDALSKALMRESMSRQYPDVITFGFFCRKANLLKLKEQYACTGLRLGLGIVFHIAPSNVPVNFAYSMVAGLLAGNVNVVRVSQKQFPQVDIIVKHMNATKMRRVAVVRYSHDSNANEVFSRLCDVRVIWGGDATIETIRKNTLPARAFDICFADRYSIAAIRPKAILDASDEEITKLAEHFYNDTYLFDQNACSAPHLVCWEKSENMIEAKERFWNAIYKYAKAHYQFQEVMAVDKLTALYKQAVAMPTRSEETEDNLLCRVKIDSLPCDIDSFRCAGGYFTECDIKSLDEIAAIVTNKYQTMAYYGFDRQELEEFVQRNCLTGLDRIVPLGETTVFSLTWDGMNLIERTSRIIDIL